LPPNPSTSSSSFLSHQGNEKAGTLKIEFEATTEHYPIICSAPSNEHICKSSEWKMDGEPEKCIDYDTMATLGE